MKKVDCTPKTIDTPEKRRDWDATNEAIEQAKLTIKFCKAEIKANQKLIYRKQDELRRLWRIKDMLRKGIKDNHHIGQSKPEGEI